MSFVNDLICRYDKCPKTFLNVSNEQLIMPYPEKNCARSEFSIISKMFFCIGGGNAYQMKLV